MDSWTQLGIAGLTLGILFFMIRYFVGAMTKKDQVIATQYESLKDLTVRSIEATIKFTEAININTTVANQTAQVAQQTAEVARQSSENLSRLMVELIKAK